MAPARRACRGSGLRPLGDRGRLPEALSIRSSGGIFLYDAAGRLFALANTHRSSPRGFSRDEVATLTAAQAHVTNLVAAYTSATALDSHIPAELEESHGLLSPREAEVVRLLCRRLSASQIGSVLHISPRTVEQHVLSIYRKLDVRSKGELVRTLGHGRPEAERRGVPREDRG